MHRLDWRKCEEVKSLKKTKIDVYKKMNVSGEKQGNKKQEHEEKNIRKQTPPTDKDNMWRRMPSPPPPPLNNIIYHPVQREKSLELRYTMFFAFLPIFCNHVIIYVCTKGCWVCVWNYKLVFLYIYDTIIRHYFLPSFYWLKHAISAKYKGRNTREFFISSPSSVF